MKLVVIAAVAALATVASATSCDVASIETAVKNSDTTTCASDSGYTVSSLVTPSDAEMALMCTSTACQSVLSQLEEAAPTECTLGAFSLYADLITPLEEFCSGESGVGIGTIIGIVVGVAVFVLLAFAIFVALRRRMKQPTITGLPIGGKQARGLQGEPSSVDTGYHEIAKTAADSASPMPSSNSDWSRLWEDPVILAARISIERVQIGDVIGRGGFGVVHRGRYHDQDVAIKMLLPEKRKNLFEIQAFLCEVQLMATMEHPHIVRFIGMAWDSPGELCCLTELMAGGDLRSLLQSYHCKGVPQGMSATKLKIAYQVAYALTYLHSLDPVVLHRDLKSRNILLTESHVAKITDFGSSRVRSDATMTAGVGSLLWMAPEVMMGERYDEKADVFSLGVVISELDTHELPYSYAKEDGGSSSSSRPLPNTAVLQMVLTGKLQVRFSRYMDPDMVRFVGSCVSSDPKDRPTTAEVLYYLQMANRNYSN